MDRVIQEIDANTGEILRSFGIAGDQDLFVGARGAEEEARERAPKTLFQYPEYFVKVFYIREGGAYLLANAKLFTLITIMARHLTVGTGLLKNGTNPYTWTDLAEEVGVTRAAIYKHRTTLLRRKLVAEIKIFGKKHIALNPLYVGIGKGVPTHISHLFEKRNRDKVNKKEMNNGRRK